MAKRIKYPPSAIRRCDKKLKTLLQEIIDTKTGGTTKEGVRGPARVLNQNTGELRNKIKPVIKVKGGELQIDMEVVKYYQYLDEGTQRIKYPWFLTEEFTKHDDFIKAIEELTSKGLAYTLAQSFKKNSGDGFSVSSSV